MKSSSDVKPCSYTFFFKYQKSKTTLLSFLNLLGHPVDSDIDFYIKCHNTKTVMMSNIVLKWLKQYGKMSLSLEIN